MPAITKIYEFNEKAGLLDKPYNDKLESSFPIEEALEGFNLFDLVNEMRSQYDGEESPKEYSRLIINSAGLPEYGSMQTPGDIPDVDRLDKHLDIIVYSLGSIFKLGLSPSQAMEALDIVATANMQKLNAGKDEYGKQLKPEGFVSPEEKLRKFFKE